MLIALLSAAVLATSPAADSIARLIGVTPAESLRVTGIGPASGSVVVIVPGIVSPAFAFRKVLPPLAEAGVRTLVIEPLGFGTSNRPGQADYSHAAQAARVAAVMDAMHVSHAVVLGHSVGTAIALRLALARPDLVRSLVLVEGGALESPAVSGVKKALQFSFLVRLFAGRGRIKKEVRKGFIASSGDASWVTDSVIERYTEGPAGDIGAVLRALKGMQRSTEPDSLAPRLGQVHVPVLLLLGGAAHEGGPSPGRVRTLERRLPSFRQRTVYGAGLHIHEEQPEVIVESLLEMVRAGPS
jgi:pimeloyl-ACP methyl ester carboxylesterase